MRRIDRLIREARESCEWRGHRMRRFTHTVSTWRGKPTGRVTADSECWVCGMTVEVDTNPPPNGIDIAGEAVALDCH